MGRLIGIGDIHGCYYTLMDMLEKIKYNKENDTIVFVGDYIDRGKHSFEVVSFLKNLQKEVGKDKCICIKGNHEYMACDTDMDLWVHNGGNTTKRSYYKNGCHYYDDKWWFNSLPLYYETDKYIFCHAGLTYCNLQDNGEDDLLWGRNWIRFKTKKNDKQVIFGHTPTHLGECWIANDGSICIDAGCVFGGKLCAIVIEENNQEFFFQDKNSLD